MILFFIISFIIEDFYTLVNKSEHTWCIVLRTSVIALCFTFPAKSAILKIISNGYSYSAGCGSFNTEVLFMFRLWGKKYGKTIACFRTPLSVMTAMIPEPTRSFTDLRKSVIRWIWEILSGWMPQCGISKKHDKGPLLSG